jgi:hypothetical protein
MHTSNEELERILENPDNIIVSSELESILDFTDHLSDTPSEANPLENYKTCILKIWHKEYIVKIKKMTRHCLGEADIFKFVLFVPTFDLEDLIQDSYLTLCIDEFVFVQDRQKSITWKGDSLSITTRRKFNETV